jgi:acyl-homoserine-lactone acylase
MRLMAGSGRRCVPAGRVRGLLVCTAALLLASCIPVRAPEAGAAGRSVTVYRDDWGVPHVYAEREEDGFYGLGYAQAEDQLEPLLGAVYWARGRRAELEGEAHLAGDIERRRWRHAEEGTAALERLGPQVGANYDAFVDGMKRFMADHPERVPAWAPTLDSATFLTIIRAVFWSGYAGVLGPAECREEGGELQARNFSPDEGRMTGASNGWSVAPARTASGATIVLADPHLEMQSPAYYEYRMHAGALHSSGFALGPLLWQANNEHVAWAMTTGNPDMWDCYVVDVDSDQPNRYRYDGEWRQIEQIEEVFRVRGGETVTHTFEYIRHNGVLSPVVDRRDGRIWVVSASQMHDTGLLDNEIRQMNLARSVFDLQRAMRTLGMFPQNLVTGDSAGHIWYLRAGKTPIRPQGYDWKGPVPGNDSATAWQGFYPLEEMLQILNPPQRYLQNNNVAPDAMFGSDNLDATAYDPGLFNDEPGRATTRGLRTIEVLSSTDSFSVEDAFALAFDEVWITAAPWLDALRYALEQQPGWLARHEGAVGGLVRRMLEFDGVASADSSAALNFYYWRAGMNDVLARPEFAGLRSLPWAREQFTPGFGAAILEQAVRAAERMEDELGGTDIALGDVFRIGRAERSWPLGGETINAEGGTACLAEVSPLCDRTLRAFASGPVDEHGQRRAYRGSNSIRLVEFTDPLRAWSLHVYGQSNDPDSPHYDDQARLLSERKLKPAYFHREDLENHVESRLELVIPR